MSDGSILCATLSTPLQADPSRPASSHVDPTSTFTRSASYTQLPTDAKVDTTPTRRPSLSRSFSENVLANIHGNVSRRGTFKKGPDDALKSPRRSLSRLGSSKQHKDLNTSSTTPKFAIGPEPSSQDRADEGQNVKDGTIPGTERKAPSVARSVSTLARKSWISKSRSRSPSPSPTKTQLRKETGLAAESTRHSNGTNPAVDVKTFPLSGVEVSNNVREPSANGHAKGSQSRRNSMLTRPRRPLSSILSKAPPAETPAVPSIPKSFSTDRLPLSSVQSISSKIPAVPKSWSSDRLQGLGAETPRRKDELWGVFRTLDGEHQK